MAEGHSEEWVIERLVPNGDGFVRLADGRVGFAQGALPGDRIRPSRLEDRKSYVRALEWSLVTPSRVRVAPPCPVARACGGCDWIELERSAQLEAKASLIREALERTGGLRRLPGPIRVVSRGEPLAYRNRLRLHIDEAGKIGLYARGSHRVVEVPGCAVCRPELNDALVALRELGARRPGALTAFAGVELRVAPGESRVFMRFQPRDKNARTRDDALRSELSARFAVSVVGASFEGTPALQRYELPLGTELLAPASAFTQVNWDVNRALIERVLELTQAHSVRRFVELFAGAGNFTLPLLAAGLSGVAIEGNPAAARALGRSAQKFAGAFEVTSGDAAKAFAKLPPRAFDLVLLDPPRSGARAIMPEIVRRAPPHVAICACDPVTLARDLRILTAAGYELVHVEGYDMFPQTHHVEVLTWLTSRS